MKKYLYIALAIILLASGIIGLIQQSQIKSLKSENSRLESNQSALMSDVVRYKTKDSLNAISVSVLTLKKDEVEAHRADLIKQVDNLNIKLKRVESINNTLLSTNVDLKAKLQDSTRVVYRDSIAILDSIRCFRFSDKYISVIGCIDKNDSVDFHLGTTIKINQIVHRVPKQFWFIKYGTKAIQQEITVDNPYTRIDYSEYINLK